jgi:phosphoenolpyruvate carboxykinase (GTP)
MSSVTPFDYSVNTSPLSDNQNLLQWVDKIATLTLPDSIYWVDGSQAEYDRLCERLVRAGTFIKLNQAQWPGCYYARSDPSDVARVEDRTFICSLDKDGAGPTNNWEDPTLMRNTLEDLFRGCMKGRMLYVLPFSMGPIGSPLSQLGVLRAQRWRAASARATRCGLAVQPGEVYRPLSGNARGLVLRVWLRRQRLAGQEMRGAAHRL